MTEPQTPHKRRTPCCSIEAHRYLDNIEGDHDTLAADLALAAAVRRLPRGFIAVLVDASEGYTATLEWQDEQYTRHTTHGTGATLTEAIEEALSDE